MTVEDEGTYMCKANNGLNALQLDGLKVLMLKVSGNRLYIAHAEARHKGLYQCFAENRVGLTHAELLVNVDITIRDTVKLVPPSIPEVKQLSDQSVMLNWTVPENKGPEIAFFRVQYKWLLSMSKDSKLKDNDNRWKTPDVEINSHVRQFEVSGLKSRGTYKFCIAAVYSNNDNAYSDYHIPEDALASSPIEGFYIYYKPYHSSEPFQNVTLLEPSVRAHLLQDVMLGTEYLIKMQSFNAAGNRSFSNQAVMKTEGESSENPDIIILPPPMTKYPPTARTMMMENPTRMRAVRHVSQAARCCT
ncbi:IHOG-like protein [Mya arenaria]|uniref:IHOG-like protein n=1 Tax=Mya arenaria TaxID=6604 RepID=A0ABY7F0V2_MYAAR|nr:IHOG-like protein [Mya arenaria]